jgi:hypothetical protein
LNRRIQGLGGIPVVILANATLALPVHLKHDFPAVEPPPGDPPPPPQLVVTVPEISVKSPTVSPEVQNELSQISILLVKCEGSIGQFGRDLASHGETLDTTITSNFALMRQSFKDAQHKIDDGDQAAAHANLENARELARKIRQQAGQSACR